MFKKLAIAGAVGALLLGLFFGRDAASYVSTSMGWVHDSVKQNVPIDFELQRARKMIRDLGPEIRRNMSKIATEEVKVSNLQGELERAEEKLAQSKKHIMRLNDDLKSGTSTFVYAGQNYTPAEVKKELENRFTRYQKQQATAEQLVKILEARQKGLQAAQQKLKDMVAAKQQLEVDVENLEARQRMVEVYQTNSKFNFDDSQLARTRDLIDEIQARIDVEEKLVNSEGNLVEGGIPLENEESLNSDISEQVTEYFGDEDIDLPAYVGKSE